jgi:hypothetical protein
MPDAAVALPPDVGLCTCQTRNSLRATRCHNCGSTLPWVKVKPEPAPKSAKPPKIEGALNNKVSVNVDTDTLTVWGVGMVVFFISLFFPFVGLWIYRAFHDESPVANFAAAGGLCGLALWVWVGMDNAVNKPDEFTGTTPSP